MENAIKEVKALKVGKFMHVNGAFTIMKTARNTFRISERHGDCLMHGTAEKCVARAYKY